MLLSRLRCLALLAVATFLSAAVARAAAGPTITLTVDATQAPTKVLRTHLTMPVKPGPLTLYYPKWIPGEHEPDGPVGNVAGLKFSAGGQTIPWRRDSTDMFAFHVDIPKGAGTLDADFEYLEPAGGGYSAGASATAKLLVVSWNQNLLYPGSDLARDITFKATLKLPPGWKFGTALPVASQSGDEIEFEPVSLDRLVDSPVISGEYYRVVDVTPPGELIHHEIDMAADSEAALEMSPEVRQDFVNLVAETGKLFGTRHYRDYHFLLTLSNHVAHFGLEHHESDDSRTGEDTLTSPRGRRSVGGLLSHEFVHSWNGKFRRPLRLSTPYYDAPEVTDMLWVYEGLTDYLGNMLAARSGLWTPQEYRDDLASVAASLGPGRPGRTWRPLQDTTDAIPLMSFSRGGISWRRGSDYYEEGNLLWLEVNTTIHQLTDGKKSLDDFCRLFHGGPNNGPELKPYTFEEMVTTLNQVAPYDWAGFFHTRLTSTSPEAPVGGIEAGGWKVEFNDKPPRGEGEGGGGGGGGGGRGFGNTLYSIGLALSATGDVSDSIHDGPAYRAGITPGMTVVAVNGRKYTSELLKQAVDAAAKNTAPIELLVLNDDYYKTCAVDYHGGERYPHLVRDESKPDLLDDIIKPLAAAH
ncbi:MAG: M61 family metallopeptidase [Terriglobia bacterium]